MTEKPDIGQIKVRLPERLRQRLERASDKSGRSLNNEIVWRLTQSFALVEAAEQASQIAKEGIEEIRRVEEELRGRLERLEKKS
jgi:hypothetical protein